MNNLGYYIKSYRYQKTSNPGPVAHGTSTHTVHTVLRNPSMALLQARLAQNGLRALECTSDGSCFFSSVAHQLYNDPSYPHMNVHTAGVEYIRNNRQKFIGPITEQLWVCYLSNIHSDALIVQAVSDVLNVTIRISESIEGCMGTTNCYQYYKRTTGYYCEHWTSR